MRGDSGFVHTSLAVLGPLAPTAEELLREYGDALLGNRIFTQPFGSWPGGIAKIVAIRPDENAPDIVFTVRGEDNAVKRAIKRG